MIKITTNKDDFFKSVEATFENLIDADKLIRKVAFDSVALVSERIQQKGLDATSTKMQTKSKNKFGAYSENYGKSRAKKGRQTDIIDLTNSGDMMADFLPVQTDKNEYSVGFIGDNAAKKAKYNENKFGEIFVPTPEEQEILENEFLNGINDILGL